MIDAGKETADRRYSFVVFGVCRFTSAGNTGKGIPLGKKYPFFRQLGEKNGR